MSSSDRSIKKLADEQSPQVSVIIAAYNSSARLKCAVSSVLQQSHSDLEVIVVGDCCTDDSENVLRSLEDPRIRWENLTRNWGEQSVASNRGIELARGEYIFFLNQDDMWLPTHVADCLDLLQRQGHDLVWSPYLVIPPGTMPGASSGDTPVLMGIASQHPRFDPRTFIPASCTAWRATALRQIGGWRTAAEVTVSPSQDLLWRASKHGLSIRGLLRPSVIVLWSGNRPGSYRSTFKASDNESWLRAISGSPGIVDADIERALQRPGSGRHDTAVAIRILRFMSLIVGPFVEATGRHPKSLEVWLKYLRSGGFINYVRRLNNLERLDFRRSVSRRGEE